MKKVIIIVLFLAVLLGVAFYFLAPQIFKKQEVSQPITLTIWGLWEDEKLIKPILDEYTKSHPNVSVKYIHQTSLNYRSRVQTQISAGGEGSPDIFMIHNSWLPMFLQSNSLISAENTIFNLDEYKKSFNPVMVDAFVKDNKTYGVARGIDGLALYYNEDLLKASGITSIPQTWPDFINAAVKTTVIDSQNQVQTAGAALGATGNVDHWSDIVGLLFLQNPGASLEAPNTLEGAEVIKFYTNFTINPAQKTWDVNLESSTLSFAAGKLAFYFAPSWRAFEIKQLNPNLNFKTAPVPQLPNKSVSWATFWGYAVSQKSVNPTASWEFLKYFSSVEVQKTLYQQASSVRLFGLPYSQTAIQKELELDPIVGSFIKQAPSYKFWFLSSRTFDQGINDEIIKYYEDAINAVVFNRTDPLGALQTTATGVKQTLDKYLKPPPVATP